MTMAMHVVLAALLVLLARSDGVGARRELGWWLHLDRNLTTTLEVMALRPHLYTSINVFHSNYSIGADGSLVSPSASSVASWLVPLRRAVPEARIALVLGGGHAYPPSAPLPAAVSNPEFVPAVAEQLRQHHIDGVQIDWENGGNFTNASAVLRTVISQLSRALTPDNRTVSLCVASGWLPYLDQGTWTSYAQAGASRLMTMSTYPLT